MKQFISRIRSKNAIRHLFTFILLAFGLNAAAQMQFYRPNDKTGLNVFETTKNDTYNLSAGYTLEGNDIKSRHYEALSFSAPFAVSSMVDKDNQQWLNKLWVYITAFKLKDFDYYDNTIKMLDMIVISGNYWDIR